MMPQNSDQLNQNSDQLNQNSDPVQYLFDQILDCWPLCNGICEDIDFEHPNHPRKDTCMRCLLKLANNHYNKILNLLYSLGVLENSTPPSFNPNFSVSDRSVVSFNLQNYTIECSIRDNKLRITADDSISVAPLAANSIEISSP